MKGQAMMVVERVEKVEGKKKAQKEMWLCSGFSQLGRTLYRQCDFFKDIKKPDFYA